MADNNQILELIQEIFNNKFDALDKKLDLLTTGLESNHNKLEVRVSCAETDIVSLKNRRVDDKLNVKNEVLKTIIHWGIPIVILAIIYFIQQGQLHV
ncbi:MAG: hypothetical protein CVV47_07055 [Spirochaetae bacterium HGW-Spirochaetae-3]|jgi:hypothetical protein|nr:MAG: hypothetical protein CVV47_07055 [Spirochaetae bacterium HGW-Spirochaetae-3]